LVVLHQSLASAPAGLAAQIAPSGLAAYAYTAARVNVPFGSSSRKAGDVNGECAFFHVIQGCYLADVSEEVLGTK